LLHLIEAANLPVARRSHFQPGLEMIPSPPKPTPSTAPPAPIAVLRERSGRIALFVQLAIALASGLFLYMGEAAHIGFPAWFWPAVFTSWLLWAFFSKPAFSNHVSSAYYLFLVAAFLFNSGRAIAFWLDPESFGELSAGLSAQEESAAWLSVFVSLSWMHLGALSYATLVPNRQGTRRPAVDNRSDPRLQLSVRTVGFLLVAVSLVPSMISYGHSISTVSSEGYMGLYDRSSIETGAAAGWRRLSDALVPGLLFILAGSSRRDRRALLVVFGLATITSIQLFLGYRGWAVLPLVAAAWVWNRRIRPISIYAVVLVSSFFLFVVFPVIPILRTGAGTDRYSLDNVSSAVAAVEDPAANIFVSMGATQRTVAYIERFVPRAVPFQMGASYAVSLTTVFPNLFWDVHPALARGSLARQLTEAVDPQRAARGGGIGFSFIAESYLNFGRTGYLICSFLIGFSLLALGQWSARSVIGTAFVGVFLSHFLFYARGESAVWVRPSVWFGLVPALAAWGLSRFRILDLFGVRAIEAKK